MTDNYGNVLRDRDGVFAQPVVAPNMSAPPNNSNVRPMQIVAQAPQQSLDNREFIGMGYGIGCLSVAGCTGTYKRLYRDGWLCGTTWQCGYHAEWRTAVSVGDKRTVQMQRKYNGSTYEWRLYFDGSTSYVVYRPQMSQGFASLGSENTQSEWASPHTAVTMVQDPWDAVYVHGNGGASANPPGTTNMSPARGLNVDQPHSPWCTASVDTTYHNRFRMGGSC